MAVILTKRLSNGVFVEIDDTDYIQKTPEEIEYERERARRVARSILVEIAQT